MVVGGALGWVVSEPLSGLSPVYAGEFLGGGWGLEWFSSFVVLFVVGVGERRGAYAKTVAVGWGVGALGEVVWEVVRPLLTPLPTKRHPNG